jgi:septal ring factor EnvC (AmiA/AmiB activator)
MELVMSKANKAKEALANAQQVLKDAEPKRKEKQKTLRDKQALLAKTQKQLEEGKAELLQLTDTEGGLRDSVKKMRGQLEDSKSAQQASRCGSTVSSSALFCVCPVLLLSADACSISGRQAMCRRF